MAKPRRKWNRLTFHKCLNEGCGLGIGKDYLPFIRIHDIPSKGICTRILSETCKRVHHLLSRNELDFFFILDYDQNVVDIREQFPLLNWNNPHDLNPVVSLAENHGIVYPRDSKSKYPYVQTTDFLVTLKDGSHHAYSIKESKEFSKARVRELQEFERIYWKELNVPWTIITEIELNDYRSKNIQWIYHARNVDWIFPNRCLLDQVMDFEKELFITTVDPIVNIANRAQEKYSLSDGLGLTAFQRLLFERKLDINLKERIDIFAYRFDKNTEENYSCMECYL